MVDFFLTLLKVHLLLVSVYWFTVDMLYRRFFVVPGLYDDKFLKNFTLKYVTMDIRIIHEKVSFYLFQQNFRVFLEDLGQ